MRKPRIYVTEADLMKLIDMVHRTSGLPAADVCSLHRLRDELERAVVCVSQNIPPDAVTIGSTVRVRDLKTGVESIFEIVLPLDSDVDNGRISVLAPVGAALLGYRAGDSVTWPVPSGTRTLRIEAVLYQPEAAIAEID